jgi:hypothetical protein
MFSMFVLQGVVHLSLAPFALMLGGVFVVGL